MSKLVEISLLVAGFLVLSAAEEISCPAGFIYVSQINGCYKIVSEFSLNWEMANLECKYLDPNAHLLIINNPSEQREVVEWIKRDFESELKASELCSQGSNSLIHLWTAGQRIVLGQKSPIVWKDVSEDFNSTKVYHMGYTNFFQGQPDFLNIDQSCVSFSNIFDYQWDDYDCTSQLCSICEIDLY